MTTEVQDAPPDRLLGLTAAAAVAQVTEATLARWADRKLVTAVRAVWARAWRKFSRALRCGPLAPGKMLAVGRVAYLLRKHPKTVARWAEEGRLPPCTRLPGGMRRWTEEDVLAYLEATGAEAGDGRVSAPQPGTST